MEESKVLEKFNIPLPTWAKNAIDWKNIEYFRPRIAECNDFKVAFQITVACAKAAKAATFKNALEDMMELGLAQMAKINPKNWRDQLNEDEIRELRDCLKVINGYFYESNIKKIFEKKEGQLLSIGFLLCSCFDEVNGLEKIQAVLKGINMDKTRPPSDIEWYGSTIIGPLLSCGYTVEQFQPYLCSYLERREYKTAQVLFENGADINAIMNKHMRYYALHIVFDRLLDSEPNSIAIKKFFKWLLSRPGIKLDAEDKDGDTVLYYCASANDYFSCRGELARALISRGANFSADIDRAKIQGKTRVADFIADQVTIVQNRRAAITFMGVSKFHRSSIYSFPTKDTREMIAKLLLTHCVIWTRQKREVEQARPQLPDSNNREAKPLLPLASRSK